MLHPTISFLAQSLSEIAISAEQFLKGPLNRCDDGHLVVDSAPLVDHRSTYSNGEPPGAHKHIIECYSPGFAGYDSLLSVDHPGLVEE